VKTDKILTLKLWKSENKKKKLALEAGKNENKILSKKKGAGHSHSKKTRDHSYKRREP